MNHWNDDDKKEQIERRIYQMCDDNITAALVAYALIQCAAALNRIADGAEGISESLYERLQQENDDG